MKVSSKVVKLIAHRLVRHFQELPHGAVAASLKFQDYHGFAKARFSGTFLQKFLGPHRVTPAAVQIEVIRVTTDLSREIHFHEGSYAFVVILGPREHFAMAQGARAFMGGWIPACSGDEIEIPPTTRHGFTVEEGGVLYFLSVQSPPIVDGQGHDDYHRVDT